MLLYLPHQDRVLLRILVVTLIWDIDPFMYTHFCDEILMIPVMYICDVSHIFRDIIVPWTLILFWWYDMQSILFTLHDLWDDGCILFDIYMIMLCSYFYDVCFIFYMLMDSRWCIYDDAVFTWCCANVNMYGDAYKYYVMHVQCNAFYAYDTFLIFSCMLIWDGCDAMQWCYFIWFEIRWMSYNDLTKWMND